MKYWILTIVVGFTAYAILPELPTVNDDADATANPPASAIAELRPSTNQRLAEAFKQRQSGVQVEGSGVVIKTLSDDRQGSQHQRFIIRVATNQTVLVAHNIDLAPRVDSLKAGDRIEFSGEYEWNDQGGVLHWTHHDPKGSHKDGWLRHKGKLYE